MDKKVVIGIVGAGAAILIGAGVTAIIKTVKDKQLATSLGITLKEYYKAEKRLAREKAKAKNTPPAAAPLPSNATVVA
jgi:uridine kinase